VRRTEARRDALVVLATLAALVAWEASGLDLVSAAAWGDAGGFVWRDHWLFRRVLHDGGRVLSGLALAACAVWAWRGDTRVMPRRQRFAWLGMIVLCIVAVPALKRFSSTSCPWSLVAFGGEVPYVPHWLLGVFDGGPGHCFPSGHAVAAFAFLPLYFQWRHARPLRARRLLVATLGAGALFGLAQLVRGAHFPSHTLWSAWLCWTVGALAAQRLPRSETAADGELQLHLDGRARAG